MEAQLIAHLESILEVITEIEVSTNKSLLYHTEQLINLIEYLKLLINTYKGEYL